MPEVRPSHDAVVDQLGRSSAALRAAPADEGGGPDVTDEVVVLVVAVLQSLDVCCHGRHLSYTVSLMLTFPDTHIHSHIRT